MPCRYLLSTRHPVGLQRHLGLYLNQTPPPMNHFNYSHLDSQDDPPGEAAAVRDPCFLALLVCKLVWLLLALFLAFWPVDVEAMSARHGGGKIT